MILDLLSDKAKDELTKELSNVIDDLANIKSQQIQKRYLKVKEAHQYLHIGDDPFRKLRESGAIKPITITGTALERFARKELDKFKELNQL